jgi:hypothetical protein
MEVAIVASATAGTESLLKPPALIYVSELPIAQRNLLGMIYVSELPIAQRNFLGEVLMSGISRYCSLSFNTK